MRESATKPIAEIALYSIICMHVDKQIKRIFGTYYQINIGNEYKKGKSFSLELFARFSKYGKLLSIVKKRNMLVNIHE